MFDGVFIEQDIGVSVFYNYGFAGLLEKTISLLVWQDAFPCFTTISSLEVLYFDYVVKGSADDHDSINAELVQLWKFQCLPSACQGSD